MKIHVFQAKTFQNAQVVPFHKSGHNRCTGCHMY